MLFEKSTCRKHTIHQIKKEEKLHSNKAPTFNYKKQSFDSTYPTANNDTWKGDSQQQQQQATTKEKETVF